MSSPSPAASITPAPNPFSSTGGLSVRATVLYIGLSMGTLLLILIALMLALILCMNPRRRRREALELAARQQRDEEHRKLEEEKNFTPTRTQLPVVIVMPNDECEYGRKISVECLDSQAAEECASFVKIASESELSETESTSYYLRGKHPHYFEAHIYPSNQSLEQLGEDRERITVPSAEAAEQTNGSNDFKTNSNR